MSSSVHDLAGRVVGLRRSHDSMLSDLGGWRSSAGGSRVRSVFDDGWIVELDTGAPPLETFDLPGLGVGDLLEVQLAELELLHEGVPRLARLAPDHGPTGAVFVDRPTSSWAAWFPCTGCGGYPLPLPFSAALWLKDPDGLEGRLGLEAAREGALVLMERFAGASCPGCSSARVRGGEIDISAEGVPTVWLDVHAPEPGWQLWLPLEGSGSGVTLPLDLPPWCEPEEVDEAARILGASGMGSSLTKVQVYDWEEEDDGLDL